MTYDIGRRGWWVIDTVNSSARLVTSKCAGLGLRRSLGLLGSWSGWLNGVLGRLLLVMGRWRRREARATSALIGHNASKEIARSVA
jgi:hypothetical protein